jgi:hypothetical protein
MDTAIMEGHQSILSSYTMQQVSISQEELSNGSGQFHEYMKFVAHRLTAKSADPRLSLFAAVDLIRKDGYKIKIGTYIDDAGVSVRDWLKNFYGERQHISYCLPSIAYQINGITYLLRMPILRGEKILISHAAIDLTEEVEREISDKALSAFEREYNEFYNALYQISKFDTTVVAHLETAAQRIFEGAAHYASARWESLHFVEKAMKEIIKPLGIDVTGADGHEITGRLHDEWMRVGKPQLPIDLLDSVTCSSSMRYEKTPQPYLVTLKAHHASIRLGALIAHEAPKIQAMGDSLSVSTKTLSRDASLEMARVVQALDPRIATLPPVKLVRTDASN